MGVCGGIDDLHQSDSYLSSMTLYKWFEFRLGKRLSARQGLLWGSCGLRSDTKWSVSTLSAILVLTMLLQDERK
jgi:hypothetical protein